MHKRIPPGGLPAWSVPDAGTERSADLQHGLPVEVIEARPSGWMQVRATNGWEGWVDGRRLDDAEPPPATPPPPPTTPVPAPEGSRRSRRRLVALVGIPIVVAAGVGAFVALGGDDDSTVAADGDTRSGEILMEDVEDEDGGEDFADPEDDDEQEGAQEDEGETAEHVDAITGETTTYDPSVPSEIDFDDTTFDPDSDPLVAGSDPVATAILRADVAARGVDLLTTGIDLRIFPVAGTHTSIVVIDIPGDLPDDAAETADGTPLADVILLALLDSAALDRASVSDVAMNVSGTDDEGPFVATLVLPLADLRASADAGELQTTNARYEIRRS